MTTLREYLSDLDDERRELIMEHFNNEVPFILPVEGSIKITVHHQDVPNHTTIERAGYWSLIQENTSVT